MSFDNAYPNRKDRRSRYWNSGKYSRGCRPGGDCDHCRRNRTHRNERRKPLIVPEELLWSR